MFVKIKKALVNLDNVNYMTLVKSELDDNTSLTICFLNDTMLRIEFNSYQLAELELSDLATKLGS